MNVFYVSISTTENYEFDKIRTAGVTGNATNYKNSQCDNPICSTRDEVSQPSRPFSPRAATAARLNHSSPSTTVPLENGNVHVPTTWQESELMSRNNGLLLHNVIIAPGLLS